MKEFKFYGVCGNEYKLDDTVWEAIEDEQDGYRSYLDCIKKKKSDGIFQYNSIATIKIIYVEDYDSFTGYKLIDVEDGHEWLRIGTDYSDDYYPCFVFRYVIKEDNIIGYTEWEEFIN